MFHFRPLKALLIAGVVLGFGSGFASLAHHHRWHGCHGQDRWDRDDVQAAAPVAAPAPPPAPAAAPQTIVVPSAAPQIILVMPNGGAQAIPPVVVQPTAAPAPVPPTVNVAPPHLAP